jgi:glucose-6-phosphate 1-dehydrogenase
MNDHQCDALVFFGATGDLAYKKIFPATPVHAYEPGTWGPAEVAAVTPPGGWQNPILEGGGR